MKIHKIWFTCLVLAHSFGLTAQTGKVLVSKGNNQIKGAGSSLTTIKIGQQIISTDEITVGANSYLGILASDGHPIEIKTPGTYKIKDLIALKGNTESVTAKYINFVTASSNEETRNKLAATGAVHRGNNEISVLLPTDANLFVYNDKFTCTWTTNSTVNKRFLVTITDLFEEPLITEEVVGNHFEVDLNRREISGQTSFVIMVSSATNRELKSEQYIVRKISEREKKEVQSQLLDLALEPDDSVFGNLALAGYYSQRKLLIDALSSFERAVSLSSSDEQIKSLYLKFLDQYFPKQ